MTSAAIRRGAITQRKIGKSSVVAGKIATNTVASGNLGQLR